MIKKVADKNDSGPGVEKLIRDIYILFSENADPLKAEKMEAYMRNQFAFLGIPSPHRKKLQSLFVKEHKAALANSDLEKLVYSLWEQPEREYQYFAMEMYYALRKVPAKSDLHLIEYMIRHNSWWDTVDYLAPWMLGRWMEYFPDEKEGVIKRWLDSKNIWLQRSCLIFQLRYKQRLDTNLLEYVIIQLNGTHEFFINKAIGWILREYGKTNPVWVSNFCKRHTLHSLSQREAMRIILKSK